MPVVIHCRDAWEDMASILESWARPLILREPQDERMGRLGVMHYFTGALEEAKRYISLGFLISIHTSVTHPKASGLRGVVAELPLESLVIETDSPYGAPQANRGKRNEPSFVIEAAKQIAQLKGIPLEDVATATAENARRLFGVPATAAPRMAGATS
jgi:TatD DNase family protein